MSETILVPVRRYFFEEEGQLIGEEEQVCFRRMPAKEFDACPECGTTSFIPLETDLYRRGWTWYEAVAFQREGFERVRIMCKRCDSGQTVDIKEEK